MNSFGRSFQVQIFGESHGALVGALIDGCPAGLALEEADLLPDLERRRAGRAGTTARREPDVPAIRTGVYRGRTTGAPILVEIENLEADRLAYDETLRYPRPGHADLAAWRKTGGFADPRGGGAFSGRLTAPLVAAGAVAKKLLEGLDFEARLVEAGGREDVEAAVREASEAGDSVGGIVECRVSGLPQGVGEPFFDTLEGLLAHAAFAVPGVKAIEFGLGFGFGRSRGTRCREVICDRTGTTRHNFAGGVDGGMSNGNPVVFRVAVKPAVSFGELRTIDLWSGKRAMVKASGRHDACIALRVPPVLEAVTAIVLADQLLIAGRLPRVVEDAPRRHRRKR